MDSGRAGHLQLQRRGRVARDGGEDRNMRILLEIGS